VALTSYMQNLDFLIIPT